MEKISDNARKTLQTITNHRNLVRKALIEIINDLECRANVHDMSKYQKDEFDGYTYFNKIDPDLKYGSEEYEQAIASIKPHIDKAVKLHYERNSHHPEHHANVEEIPLLDVIEMVCDWYSASQTYSSNKKDTFEESIKRFNNSIEVSKNKYDFTVGQLWVIDEVAKLLRRIR